MKGQYNDSFDSSFSNSNMSSSSSYVNFDPNSNSNNIDEIFQGIGSKNSDVSVNSENDESLYYISQQKSINFENVINNLKPEKVEINSNKEKIFYLEKVKRPNYYIFSPRKCDDDFSKKIIDELNLNEQLKKRRKVITCQELKHKRKQNADNIRKKIKARFLKALKNRVNDKLKLAGSNYFIKFLPLNFVKNITKKFNKSILNLTFKEIFSNNFFEGEESQNIGINNNNYKYNAFVLNYLEKNKIISKKINFNIIKNMTYSEIFKEYFLSREFELEITNLKKYEKEKDLYIKNYIIKANDFINFFSQ